MGQVRGRRTPDGLCRHHFILGDSRKGAVAVGTCVYCGVQRAFANTLGGAVPQGMARSTLIVSWINEGRAVREEPLPGLTLGQEAESFKKGKGVP